jgi:adenylate cyclase
VTNRLALRARVQGSYQTELANGSWVNVSWRRARDGGLVGVFSDVTALKQAELSLRQSEERFSLATAAATEGLYDWDVAGDRLSVSDQLNRIIGLRTDNLSSGEWNERVHPRDRQRYRTATMMHFKGESEYLVCEYRIRSGAGEYVWVADSASSVRDARGRVVRLVGAIADISDRKHAEQELREAKQRADDASVIASEKAQALELLSTKLSKYLSPQVYSSIFAGTQNVTVDSKRKKLSIFFSDIAGFTAVVDTLESEEITAMLNDYLSAMAEIAIKFGATIDKFIGDAILAFFGDPDSKGPKEDAIACVRMGIAMQRRLRELQGKWRDLGLEQIFELRIGITTGFCTVGNFGSEDRMDYTVVGNEVNAAARLQGHAETGGILISSETYALVRDAIHAEDFGLLSLKGLSRPVHAYKVLGVFDELEEAGDLIRLNQPGLRLLFSPAALSNDDRAQARASLEAALRQLGPG